MSADAINLHGVSFAYNTFNQSPPVFRDVSLQVPAGARVVLVGANGAGKSTLLRLIGGRRKPSAGQAHVFGEDAFDHTPLANRVNLVTADWEDDLTLPVQQLIGSAVTASGAEAGRIAQLLASELAYRERRLWDWQMDNTNTKAILQKFKDRLKKTDKPKGGGGAGLRNSLLARSSAAAGTALPSSASGGVEPGTPRQIPTSAAGISMLIVEANDADARALSDSCRAIGYRVATASSGEEALELVTASLKAPGERGTTEGGEVRGRGAARESEGALAAAAAVWEGG